MDAPRTIGHVHLKVRNLMRAERFYTEVLGFRVTERVGNHYVFLSAGERHHDIALQHVGAAAPMPPPQAVGLFHVAFELPDVAALAAAYRTLRDHGIPVGPADHGISYALYFSDPDGNGIELYVDTRHRRQLWEGRDEPVDLIRLLETGRLS